MNTITASMISAQIIEATYLSSSPEHSAKHSAAQWQFPPWQPEESATLPFLKLACVKFYMISNKFLGNSKVIAFKDYILLYIKLDSCVPYIMLSQLDANKHLIDEEASGRQKV